MDRHINTLIIISRVAVIVAIVVIFLLTNEIEKDIRNEIEDRFGD